MITKSILRDKPLGYADPHFAHRPKGKHENILEWNILV